jgi:glycosyltransferase involved in cell wall biosynthesis
VEFSVVIPVYNEKDNILNTLHELDGFAPPQTQVLLIYDDPADTTLEAIPHYQGPLQLIPLHNGYGRGVLNALVFGLHSAPGDYVLVCMGDLADDLNALPPMLELAQGGADIVCGSRFMPGGTHQGQSWLKKKLAFLAGWSLHRLAGLPTHDATNSFKIYSRRLLETFSIESQGGFELGLELVVKAWVAGMPIREYPSVWRERSAGQSRFQLVRWIPFYLRWFLLGMTYGAIRRLTLVKPARSRRRSAP